ncbi:MAG: hypothetical protein DU429_05375 [Candidatus Tokpelaia sp.]|nr:MAG: hypothetical protein DU429_05375 [Candidatus Tokpelaia sp.]KAA6406350.1 hypothetical protein DPQ22_00100 [Candidatus Tokpelaia sp.]
MLFSAFGIKITLFRPWALLLPLVIKELVMYRLKTGFIKTFSAKMRSRRRKRPDLPNIGVSGASARRPGSKQQ